MAGGRGQEVALLRGLLLGREGRVVGGDMGERAVRQRLPQRRAIGLVADGRVDAGADARVGHILLGEGEVMRAGLGGELRVEGPDQQDAQELRD